MARKVFPCDLKATEDRNNRLQEQVKAEVVPLIVTSCEMDHLMTFEIKDLLSEAAQIHDRAPSWLALRIEGLSDREIADEWGVTAQYVNRWFNRYGEQIKTLVTDYLS